MKGKPAKKTRRVVAWMNKAEYDHVFEHLYSRDHVLQKHALHRISAWKGRFGQNTPVAVASTADLVRCQVLDNTGNLEANDLVLLYGMALVRFVNVITERKQTKIAKPLRLLARNLNIPEWVVNLRHDFTHNKLPSLKWCRKGCEFVLDWLHKEYWSRQLGGQLTEDWNHSEEEDEEDCAKRQEEILLCRKKEIEGHKKVRELLISYEREQFQVYEELEEQEWQRGVWPDASADLSWILTQIKHFAADSREILVDVLVQDGFLIPTAEQLESLDIDPSEDSVDVFSPCLPRVFHQFWLPLLKVLSSFVFINLILDRLFTELSNEPSSHRAYYIASWISEILLCNSRSELKAHRQLKTSKERIFVNRLALAWQTLISACVNAPCPATPFLLQQILSDMDKPLPPDTQQNLLQLCSIYTQGYHGNSSPEPSDPAQPVYTLQSLQERLKASQNRDAHSSNHTPASLQAPPTEELQEKLSPEVLQERNSALRGSAWSVCTDKVPWKQYPLGKVPGQSEDTSCFMVESYFTLNVFDQQVELDQLPRHHGNRSVPLQSRGATGSDGPLWTHNDLSKLKAGLKLF
ncbi:ribosomal biogenesis protein LAS1L [Triplophysa rosa]|uniref:Ribosomal biogenesis protein LAS1L n=1 Tax=Triplophysa rosa TaxID=992332 RepID=A0A9W7X3X7_TRIRA|nr:ribosomal biogenesis protein LAS1L [Triplophysa rosa]KAI7813305.1 ribosomal biogenesis protein LAS1L [Triplophysa rosa]